VVRLSTTLFAADGGAHVIESSNRGVFVETGIHPPRLEQQIADLAGHDLGPLAGELLRRGHRLAPYALEDMYVHVELGEELKAAIARPGSARRGYASVTGSAARASTA
jgi:hypothetical protein